MKFRDWWKKLKYWKKGGIIGFLIGLLPLLSGLLSSEGGSGIFLLNFIALPSILIFLVLYLVLYGVGLLNILLNIMEINVEYDYGIPIVLGWFLAPLVYLILGIIFGKIYQNTKCIKNE